MSAALKSVLQILRGITCHQLTSGNDHNVIAHFTDLCQNMRTQYNRMLLRQLTDQLSNLNNLLRIQTNCRLIQNNHLRESKDCLCKPNSLSVSLGQVLDQSILHFTDTRHPNHVIHLFFTFFFRYLLQFSCKLQILPNCHIHIYRRLFRQIANTLLCKLRLFQNIMPLD